jgi:phosphohistidine phosphatase SixA
VRSYLPLTWVLVLGACGADRPSSAAESAPKDTKLLRPEAVRMLSGEALLDELKRGGYILYFRHFHTDHTRWHEDPIKPRHAEMTVKDFRTTCEEQRPLTPFGRRRARDVGALMKKAGIPIGKVLSSPYCRVVESATMLAGREPDETPYELVHRGGGLTYEMMAKNIRPLLGQVPPEGTNTLMVAHRPQMDDTRFIEEGECFVLEPLGEGKFNLIGTIYDSDWYEASYNVDYLGLRGLQPGGDEPPRGVSK